MPDPLELDTRDLEATPVFIRVVEAGLAEASVAVFAALGPITKDVACVVHLDLADGPTVIANLEIPERAAPVVELIASGLVPTTAIEAVRHGGRIPSRDILFCRAGDVALTATEIEVERQASHPIRQAVPVTGRGIAG